MSSGGLLWAVNEPSGFIKCGGFLDQLSDFRNLRPIELVKQKVCFFFFFAETV
jgi:hypothetical protein